MSIFTIPVKLFKVGERAFKSGRTISRAEKTARAVSIPVKYSKETKILSKAGILKEVKTGTGFTKATTEVSQVSGGGKRFLMTSAKIGGYGLAGAGVLYVGGKLAGSGAQAVREGLGLTSATEQSTRYIEEFGNLTPEQVTALTTLQREGGLPSISEEQGMDWGNILLLGGAGLLIYMLVKGKKSKPKSEEKKSSKSILTIKK